MSTVAESVTAIPRKLAPAALKMLLRVRDGTDSVGGLMEITLIGSGGRAAYTLDSLRQDRLVESYADPNVSRRGVPATAWRVTELGRTRLLEQSRR